MKKIFFLLPLILACKETSVVETPPIPACHLLKFNDLPTFGPDVFNYHFEYENGKLVRMKTYTSTFLGMVPSGTHEVTYNEQGLPYKITEKKNDQESTVEELSYDDAKRLTRKKTLRTTAVSSTTYYLSAEKTFQYTAQGKMIGMKVSAHNTANNLTTEQVHTFTYDKENMHEHTVKTNRSDWQDYSSISLIRYLEYDQQKNPLLLLTVPFESLHLGSFSANNWRKYESGYIVDGVFTRNAFSQRPMEYSPDGYHQYTEIECK